MAASRLLRGRLFAGEWLLVVLLALSLGLTAFLLRPTPPPRVAAEQLRVLVDGAVWRVPTAAAPLFLNPRTVPEIPSRYDARTGRLDYFQDPRGPAIRQDAIYLGRRSLDYFVGRDRRRHGGLGRFETVQIGGAPRASPFPERPGEAWGPPLFARPTVVGCQDVTTLSAGRIDALCRLQGWAPGGVSVQLIFHDRDPAPGIAALEALLTDLRQDAPVS